MFKTVNKLNKLIEKGFDATRITKYHGQTTIKKEFLRGEEAYNFLSQEVGLSVPMLKKIATSDDMDLLKQFTDDVQFLLASATGTEVNYWNELLEIL